MNNSYLRIVSAIAAKDIADALKNKTTLANIILVFFIMIVYKWLPSLYTPSDTDLLVYDAGHSRLVSELENSPLFELHRVASLPELKEKMGDGDIELALAIPEDFNRRLDAGERAELVPSERAELDAYVLWPNRSAADDLQADFEGRFAKLLGQPVSINVQGAIHHAPDSMGPIRMVSITLTIMMTFMGIFTVPYLMFEERQSKTIDALLVSPASISQIVLGKALAGLFYALTASAAALAFNRVYVIHWDWAIAATLCGALLAVGLGLALGVLFQNQQQMKAGMFIPLTILLGPVFLSGIDPILPQAFRTWSPYIPTVSLTLVFRYACSNGATLAQVWSRLGIVLGGALLVLALVAYKVRRLDR
jgi:ABC-2 type transport system permease protein